MKVVEERMIRFERRVDSTAEMAIAGQAPVRRGSAVDGNREAHDARSLIVAVAMCLGCWMVLGYYMLS